MRWIYSLALFSLLVWALDQVALSPLETGEVYPPYSTLRSDPLGAKALYDSFAALPGVAADRLYKDRPIMAADETTFVLGVDPSAFSDLKPENLQDYEKLVSRGGRLVIAFLPVSARPFAARQEKSALEDQWHLALRYSAGKLEDSSAIPKETALYFEAAAPWRQISNRNAIERRFGPGSIVLVADSFPLSNEGLRDARDAGFLAGLAGPATRLLFDENHFGIAETGSVTTLMRKYRLEGALAVLALAAALFLWRSASSFLPPRPSQTSQAVAGRDAIDGMTALLLRGVPEKNLLDACFAEWRKSAPREPRAAAVEERICGARDPVEAYRAACRALSKERK